MQLQHRRHWKNRIQTRYTGDQMGQEMQTLDTLYTKAKEELANSYADHIGGFYGDLARLAPSRKCGRAFWPPAAPRTFRSS